MIVGRKMLSGPVYNPITFIPVPALATQGVSAIAASRAWFGALTQGANFLVQWGNICYANDPPLPAPGTIRALTMAASDNNVVLVCAPNDTACSGWQWCICFNYEANNWPSWAHNSCFPPS